MRRGVRTGPCSQDTARTDPTLPVPARRRPSLPVSSDSGGEGEGRGEGHAGAGPEAGQGGAGRRAGVRRHDGGRAVPATRACALPHARPARTRAGPHDDGGGRRASRETPAAGRVRQDTTRRRGDYRCEANSTTCWKVGRFCQLTLPCLMPPSVRWTIESAHHWLPAAHRVSPG